MSVDSNTSHPSPTSPTENTTAQAKNAAADIGKLLIKPWQRVLHFCRDYAGAWQAAKSEIISTSEIYMQYLVPVAALAALATFIGWWLVGISIPLIGGNIRLGFFGSLWTAITSFVGSMAAVFIAAKIFVALAPKFQVKLDDISAFKLVAFSTLPGLFAQVLSIYPSGLTSLAMLGVGIFGMFLFIKGVDVLAEVPAAKKWPYIGASLACSILAGLVLALIIGLVTPSPKAPVYSGIRSQQLNLDTAVAVSRFIPNQLQRNRPLALWQ